jgi:hypothetical protein
MPEKKPISWKRTLVLGGGAGILLTLGQCFLILHTFPNHVLLLLILGSCLYLIVPALMAWEVRVRTDEHQGHQCGVVAGVGSVCAVLLIFWVLPSINPHLFLLPVPPSRHDPRPWQDITAGARLVVAFYAVIGTQLVGLPLTGLGAWWGSSHR